MRILVTAGNTLIPIDRVRCITNVFTGRTGTQIAMHAHRRGHAVVLLSSHPELVSDQRDSSGLSITSFRTFDDLEHEMKNQVRGGSLDAVIHCAAVSDYRPAGIYTRDEGTGTRDVERDLSPCLSPLAPRLSPLSSDEAAGKIKSDELELWLRLIRTPKLVDRIRTDWHFPGILVKFKLEVGVIDERLLEIAEPSRLHSHADLMVANTLETASTLAYLGPIDGKYQRIDRDQLPERLLQAVEALHKERGHG